MSASVLAIASRQVPRAREIVAHPDLHGEAEVLDACETLINYGDWLDVQRGTLLRAAICRDAVLRHNRLARLRRLIKALAIAAAIVALLALALIEAREAAETFHHYQRSAGHGA